MKIDKHNSPYFRAKFINSVEVGKLANNTYNQVNTSFVQLDIKHPPDLAALYHMGNYWHKDLYAYNIYANAREGHPYKIFVITSQMTDFNKLVPDKILGVCEITSNKFSYGYLNYLQVNPDFIYNKQPEFKGIGSAILTSLKKLHNKISLIAANNQYVKQFYERNGFYESTSTPGYFTWYKDILEIIKST